MNAEQIAAVSRLTLTDPIWSGGYDGEEQEQGGHVNWPPIARRILRDGKTVAEALATAQQQLAQSQAEIRSVKTFAGWDADDDRPADSAAAELFNQTVQLRDELAELDAQLAACREALKRVVLWMDDNGYAPDDQSFGARAALKTTKGE